LIHSPLPKKLGKCLAKKASPIKWAKSTAKQTRGRGGAWRCINLKKKKKPKTNGKRLTHEGQGTGNTREKIDSWVKKKGGKKKERLISRRQKMTRP